MSDEISPEIMAELERMARERNAAEETYVVSRPNIEPGCPGCEFIVETTRTTVNGGCGKHGYEVI